MFYASTRARVTRVVSRTLRSPDHAAEVVQEIFLHVWQHAAAFDPAKASVLGWLSMLAHRRAVDQVRHVDRSVRRDHRAAQLVEDQVDDVAETSLRLVETTELRLAVARLPPRQRDAVWLTFFAGCTQQEAAEALCVPLGTLKSRVHAGVQNLRRGYEQAAA